MIFMAEALINNINWKVNKEDTINLTHCEDPKINERQP